MEEEKTGGEEPVKVVEQPETSAFHIPKVINFNPATGKDFPEGEKKEEKRAAEEPKKEEPVAEVKTETSVDPVKPAEEVKTETPAAAVEEKKEESLFEITNASDALKKLDEIAMQKHGCSYQDAMAFKGRVFEEEDDLDVMDTFYKIEDPDITDVELEAKSLKYRLLFNKEEREKAIADEKITHEQLTTLDAEFEGLKRKALKELNKLKANISFDEIKFSQKSEQPKEIKTSDEHIAAMKDAVTKTMNDFKQDKFVVKDQDGKELAVVNVATPDAQKVLEIAADPNSIYKLWVDKDGKLDVAAYTRDITRLQNIDKIVEVAYSLGFNKGKVHDEKEGSNITIGDKKPEAIHKEGKVIGPREIVLQNS